MAKSVIKILDDLSPSQLKLRSMSRSIGGLHNMFINELGQAEKRAGYAKYNTTSLGASHKITGMHRYYYGTSSKEFIVAWNTKWYKIAETTPWAGVALYSTGTTDFTTTADQDTYFCDFGDVCYSVNSKGVFKYDGTFNRILGITPPAAKPTGVAVGSGGSLGAGDYKYCYTYVDEDGYESNASPISDAITCVASDSVTLTIAVSTDPKIASRNIYRTSVGGAIYYYDGAVANNTGTEFTSSIADTALGTEAATNHTAPPTTAHLICKRREKLYLAYGGYLYPSYTSDVEYFPPLWRLRTGNSDKIMGLLEQLNALPVMTESSIERLIGQDEDNFEFRNSFSNKGCSAPRSLVICDNMLVYLSYDGIYYFDGTTSGIFDLKLNEYIKDNLNRTYISLSCATYFNDRYILSYAKGASTVPSETIVIDMKSKAVSIYDYAFSCFSKWDRRELRLFGGSNTVGQVYELDSGLDDDGSAIEAYDQLDYIDLGIPEREKDWFSISVRCESTTATTLTVYYQVDDNTEASVTQVLTKDTDKWYELRLPNSVTGRAIKIKTRVSDKYAITFKGYMIQYDIAELRV